MTPASPADDRRRHLRFPLGLPVLIHLEGRDDSTPVEIVDIAERGARFRTVGERVPIHQRASFGFVTAAQAACVASGRVVRVDDGGVFVLSVERAKSAFRSFVGSLSP